MKKFLNILLWITAAVLVVLVLYNLYNRYKPNALKQVPPQGIENRENESKTTDENEGTEETTKEEEQKIMAPDFELEDINGNNVKLSDYRGKIVVLNFWAVWCKYCVLEMPELERAHKKLQENDDAVIVTVNQGESIDKVKKILKDKNLSLTVLMDYNSEVGRIYGADQAIPITYIINRDGSVYTGIPGATDEETIMGYINEIK